MPEAKSAFRRDFTAGIAAIVPPLVSVVPFGLLLGALAGQKGISPLEVFLMSASIFAGSAQFIAVDMWREPVPVAALAGTVLLINLRHLLMGASVRRGFRDFSTAGAYGALFFLADEIWAFAMRRIAEGRFSPAFYLGLALPLYLNWIASTTLGSLLGGLLRDPARYGFDFAFTAIFLCILATSWSGRRSLWPWLASALVAVIAERMLPGAWYIALGGLAGMLVGAAMSDGERTL